MVQLLALLLLMQMGPSNRVILRDPLQGPTPVSDKFLIPPKIHDCRTDAEVQAALDARRVGDEEPCDPDRMLRRAR